MCGIAGKISKQPILKANLQAMTDTMVRRGPEAEGIAIFKHQDQYVGLGHRRLKIIDLSAGANQPFISEDQSVHIVFNGEIYNFLELKKEFFANELFRTHSDTEIILKLYHRFGKNLVKYLRGMFAIAIYDKKIATLYIIRDHLGKKPVFYYYQNNTLIFGSQLNTITSQPEVAKHIDYGIFDDYLTFNYIPTNNSIYKNIHKLPPATMLTYDGKTISLESYWQLSYEPKILLSKNEAITQTESILNDAVRLRMIADVPLGAFLSGGIDSGVIVALMSQYTKKVKTFSIGFDQADFNELGYAKLVAKRYQTEHHEFIVKPDALNIFNDLITAYDEPYADPSQIPMHYLAKLTKEHVTVALNGDGGDECFGGYERYLGLIYQKYFRYLPITLRKNFYELIKNIPENSAHSSLSRRIKWLTRVSLSSEASAYLEANISFTTNLKKNIYTTNASKFINTGSGEKEFLDFFGSNNAHSIVDKMLNTDVNTYLPQDLLVKADRSTMFHSLESRSPLLDYKLMEFAAKLPEKYKINNFQLKYLLKKIAEKHLPKEIIYRKKQGFGVPLGSWFKNELKPYTQELFNSSALVKADIFSKTGLNTILTEHISGKVNHGRRLFTLVMLELWYRKSIKE